MERQEFEAELAREGYAMEEKSLPHAPPKDMHVHEFDARLLVLEGEITIARDDGATTYRPGDAYSVPAGVRHSEAVGPGGVTFVVGKR